MLILYVFVYPHVLVCVFKYDIHKEHALHSYTNEILHHSLLIGITKDAIWWGSRGTFSRSFSDVGDIMCQVPPLLSLRVCIRRGFKTIRDLCHVLCEEFSCWMLHIALLMLKQSLVWYH